MMQKNSQANLSILITDTDRSLLDSLTYLFQDKGYEVRQASDLRQIPTVIQQARPDLILMDPALSAMGDYDVCQSLKSSGDTCDIPLIYMSVVTDLTIKTKAFEQGVSDYIVKPFSPLEIVKRISNILALQAVKKENQRLRKCFSTQIELEQRQINSRIDPHYLTTGFNSADLKYMPSLQDNLTGLPNRYWAKERITERLETLHRGPEQQSFVLCLEVDKFHVVNNLFGQLAGEQLIVRLVQRLKKELPIDQTMARLGREKFIFLLESVSQLDHARDIAQTLLNGLQVPLVLDDYEVIVEARLGIVPLTPAYQDAEVVLRDADIAMKQAKAHGNVCSFKPGMFQQMQRTVTLEADLRHALIKGELKLHYQPIVSLKTSQIVGFEALLRWQHAEYGNISPAEFIPIAEATGLILPIGQWVLQEACRQFKLWQDQALVPPQATISVNVSAKQLMQADLIQKIDQVLMETGLEGAALKIEITESTLIENAQLISQQLWQMRARHIKVAMDDFGTGYSSLSNLYHFPIDTLKIDRSFVSCLGPDNNNLDLIRNLVIIRAMVSMAAHLSLTVTVEGVETAEQLHQMKGLQCDDGQGFYWEQALPPDLAEGLLVEQQMSVSTAVLKTHEISSSTLGREKASNLPKY